MAKTFAKVLGAILVVVGVWGFFQNPVLGLFGVDALHNIIHIVTGVILLAMPSVASVRTLGIVYLALGALGLAMGPGNLLGFLHVNAADNWLHLALGVALLVASKCPVSWKAAAAPAAPMPPSDPMPMA